MTISENVGLAEFTTLRVGGAARFLVQAQQEADIQEAFGEAKNDGLRFEVIGGGSNLLVADEGFGGLVVRLCLRGVRQEGDLFDVAAGESWDELVSRTVAAGYAGMECLAGIPGTVGASPVQNIGAYGQEVAQTIESVRVLDKRTGEFAEMTAEDCGFRYRRSVFNGEEQGRYVITAVRFRLRADGPPFLGYADLQRWFAGKPTPSLVEVAEAVRAIRGAKGMVLVDGDHDTWSAGSYFKNPVIAVEEVAQVADAAGVAVADVPKWGAGEGYAKLSAAWLLERAGFRKGFRLGRAGLSTKHALAVTNRGGATCEDVLRLENAVRAGVRERFGVVLEREPVMLGEGASAPFRAPW